MVTKLRSRIALAIGIIGVGFTLATIFLPAVKTHETAVATGPASPYGGSDTTFSAYLIPPVDRGSKITIAITGYSPSSISLTVYPSAAGDLSPSAAPILQLSDFSRPIVRASIISPETQAYGIYVFSGNRTQYVLAVDGYWSPYYPLRAYTSEGLFIALSGFLAYYYFKHFELRRSIEEKASAEAKAESKRTSTPGGVKVYWSG